MKIAPIEMRIIADELRHVRPKRDDHEELGHFSCAVIEWRECVSAVAAAFTRLNPEFQRGLFYDWVLIGLTEDFKAAIRTPDMELT